MRKGQVWYIDMIIGVLIFIGALIYFFESGINDGEETDILEDIAREARLASGSLMGDGYPEGWNRTDVQELGIVDAGRVNKTKLGHMGSIGYEQTKAKLRTKYEYYLFFEDEGGTVWINGTHEGLGMPGANCTNIFSDFDPDDVVKTVRFVAYESNPRRMVLFLWR